MPSLRLRLVFGVFIAMNVMALNFSLYAPDLFGSEAVAGSAWGELSGLFGYLMLFLATLVLVLLGVPLLLDAWLHESGGRFPRPNASLLILAGVFAAYVLSAWHTFTGAGRPYYDTATLVLVVVTLGHYVEAVARRRAAERVASALDGLPERVEILRPGSEDQIIEIATDAVQIGDLVRVRPGDSAPVDGVVDRGRSHLDTGRLSGESRPVPVETGDRVLAGAIALDGELWIRAERVGSARTLAQVESLLETARGERPRAQRIADRIAGSFGPSVALLAIAVALFQILRGAPEEGILRGLSVLLIACPCALAIAPSLTLVSAMRRAASRGVLFATAAVVERTSALRYVFFDKTGTLTTATTEVLEVRPTAGVVRRDVLTILASIESGHRHPIARGLVEFAAAESVEPRPVERCQVIPGIGVSARVDGREYRIGGERLLAQAGFPRQRDDECCDAAIYLVEGRRLLARICLRDRVRGDAAEAIAGLQALSIGVAGLSGDQSAPSAQLAETLSMPIEAGMLPADKLARMRQMQEALPRRSTLGMVGDGINDAPALALADVGFAMSGGTDLTRQAGQVLLLDDRLGGVPEAVRIARDAQRRLRVILAWAFAYNGVGLGLAVSGLLHPAFAATAMVFSSLIVLGYAGGSGDSGRPAEPGHPTPAALGTTSPAGGVL